MINGFKYFGTHEMCMDGFFVLSLTSYNILTALPSSSFQIIILELPPSLSIVALRWYQKLSFSLPLPLHSLKIIFKCIFRDGDNFSFASLPPNKVWMMREGDERSCLVTWYIAVWFSAVFYFQTGLAWKMRSLKKDVSDAFNKIQFTKALEPEQTPSSQREKLLLSLFLETFTANINQRLARPVSLI